MVQAIKRFFEKRDLKKRLAVTRKQSEGIRCRNLSDAQKARLKHKYLKKIHWLQRQIARLEN